MKNLVLASKSPRRREILKQSGFDFSLVNSDYEEELSDNIFSYKKIENLAKNKAFGAINNVNHPSYILSADTVVILDNTILIKPKNKEDAINTMVKWLEEHHCGQKKINYRLREWIFARQRYWGEPIPVINFDDGYYSNYDYVFPILKKYNVKASIFVVTDKIGKDMCFMIDFLLE